jgi:hypothetical protein
VPVRVLEQVQAQAQEQEQVQVQAQAQEQEQEQVQAQEQERALEQVRAREQVRALADASRPARKQDRARAAVITPRHGTCAFGPGRSTSHRMMPAIRLTHSKS